MSERFDFLGQSGGLSYSASSANAWRVDVYRDGVHMGHIDPHTGRLIPPPPPIAIEDTNAMLDAALRRKGEKDG